MFPLIKEILLLPPQSQEVKIRGWVRTKRELKNLVFIEVNDGSCFKSIQCAFDRNRLSCPAASGEAPAAGGSGLESALEGAGTGVSVELTGKLVPSPASGQAVEVAAESLRILGAAPPETYPLQKKRHSLEFLREIAHLRPRTNTFGAVARIRSRLSFA
ncbi:MAG: asparagine--tRNA ligase, partial [Treponema sp.]|nr:asparagine--tRNA ligase [Treponema sp.]